MKAAIIVGFIIGIAGGVFYAYAWTEYGKQQRRDEYIRIYQEEQERGRQLKKKREELLTGCRERGLKCE